MKVMIKFDTNRSGNFFYPNKKYYSHFPFHNESDEAFKFFITIFDINRFYGSIDQGLVLPRCYGTRYLKFLLSTEELIGKLLKDSSNLYKFPFDEENVRILLSHSDKNEK